MKFKRKILKNGMRVITIHMADNPTVTVLVMVEAGSKYETKEINGLSHFLEHMCFKGTVKRPKPIDIVRELDSIGSHYNAFTSYEFTGYYAKSNAKHLETILDVVSDIYLNPTFPEKEIEKEKGVIVDEISMYEDLPHAEVNSVFMDLLYGDQAAGWKITGTKENVRTMKREDFVNYRQKHYVAPGTTVIVAGDFDEKHLQKLITEKFKDIHDGEKHSKLKVTEKQSAPQVAVKYKKTDQAHLIMGVRTFDTYSDKNITLRVLSAVLGGGMSSRLFQKIRDEMGVGYYVHSSFDTYTDHGYLDVSAGVDPTRVKEVIAAIMEEFKRLKTELVAPEELKKAKDYIVGNMYLSLESSDSLAEFYGYQEVMRKELLKPAEIAAKIKTVTAEDIQKMAKQIFTDKGLNMALVGPFEDKKEFIPLLKF